MYLASPFSPTVYPTVVYSMVPKPVPLTVGAHSINHASSARPTMALDISCERQGPSSNIFHPVRAVFEPKTAFALGAALATVIAVFEIVIH